MIRLEYQVCPLRLAQRLKEMGISQTASYFWAKQIIHWDGDRIEYVLADEMTNDPADFPETYSAFNVAELGHIFANLRYKSLGFPMVFTSYSQNDNLTAKIMGKWSVMFRNPVSFSNPEIKCDTEAEARAEILIWLLENTGLTVEMVNKAINS